MKAKLDKAYRWSGKTYLPGEEVEIPDDLAQAIGIEKKVEQKAIEETMPSGDGSNLPVSVPEAEDSLQSSASKSKAKP